MTTKQHDYFGRHIPLMALLGLEPVSLDESGARARLPWRAEITNSRGDIHGGTLMSILDFLLSAAGRSHDPSLGMATIDMTTHFMAPATTDLDVTARCLRRGASIVFCEGEIHDAKGTLVAKASASFKVLPKRPGGDA
jgi:uncharacterized protein (TIGR00369 family)